MRKNYLHPNIMVTLICAEGTSFQVPQHIVYQSKILKCIYEDCALGKPPHVISLTNINEAVMRIIIEYLYKRKLSEHTNGRSLCDMNIPDDLVLDVLLAADYLDL